MMREPLFVDTGFVRALLVIGDRYHDVALRWQLRIRAERTPLVISSAIFIELGDGFHKADQWARLRPIIAAMRVHPTTSVVTVDENVFSRALALREERADKHWGLTDCTSFIIMRDHGISAALSCDKHFRQAGFRALLIE
jgi:uncharacterized protein